MKRIFSDRYRARSVKGYVGAEEIAYCFKGADGVVIPVSVPGKPGRTRCNWFNTNAGIVRDLTCEQLSKGFNRDYYKSCELVCINCRKVLKSKGKYYPRRLFGVSILDIVLPRKFISDSCKVDVNTIDIPVIG